LDAPIKTSSFAIAILHTSEKGFLGCPAANRIIFAFDISLLFAK
jgi:hypothetical protein